VPFSLLLQSPKIKRSCGSSSGRRRVASSVAGRSLPVWRPSAKPPRCASSRAPSRRHSGIDSASVSNGASNACAWAESYSRIYDAFGRAGVRVAQRPISLTKVSNSSYRTSVSDFPDFGLAFPALISSGQCGGLGILGDLGSCRSSVGGKAR